MKRIIYVLAVFSVWFISCEKSLEDTYNELDELSVDEGYFDIDNVDFTMVDEDYELIGNAFVTSNLGFETEESADQEIPNFLLEKYPLLGNGSKVAIKYGVYNGIGVPEDYVSNEVTYEVTAEDYDSQGGSIAQFGNFSSEVEVINFMNSKFSNATQDDELLLIYDFYNGVVNTFTANFKYDQTDGWFKSYEAYVLTTADYDSQGGDVAQYDNFSSEQDILDFLSYKYSRASENFIVELTYDFYDGSVSTLINTFQYSESEWSQIESLRENVAVNETYEVTTLDYDSQDGDVAQYNNFSDPQHIEDFLNSYYDVIVDNAIVLLTYVYYDGSASELTNLFQYDNLGGWKNLTENSYMLSDEDYTSLSENMYFESITNASSKLPIYFKNELFPYAVSGDVEGVVYKVVNDDSFTYNYASLIYDGEAWEFLANNYAYQANYTNVNGIWEKDPEGLVVYVVSELAEDYDYMVDQLSSVEGITSDMLDSMSNYQNFDVREGEATYWSPENILVALNVLLNSKYTDTFEGQVFKVTYDIYDGGTDWDDEIILEVDADGNFVISETEEE